MKKQQVINNSGNHSTSYWPVSYLTSAFGILSGANVKKAEKELAEALKLDQESSKQADKILNKSVDTNLSVKQTLKKSEACRYQTQKALQTSGQGLTSFDFKYNKEDKEALEKAGEQAVKEDVSNLVRPKG